MKRTATLFLVVLGLCISAAAQAGDGRTCPGVTPNPTQAVWETRLFNDCPTSVVTTTNAYPFLLQLTDSQLDCFGFANLHVWHFSEDGLNQAVFENCSHYEFRAEVVLSGTGQGEGGLRLAPWWFDGDGKFMLNTASGEIACFGGRLPFYSFTGAHGLLYVKGTPITMQITYDPRTLDMAFPATIEYTVFYNGNLYTSGPLAFDMANPAEDPPHGLWGALYPHSAGGYVQPRAGDGTGNPLDFTGRFSNICFTGPVATPAAVTTWGGLKSKYR
jgi:hypothetical protein